MRTVEFVGEVATLLRSHPWTDTAASMASPDVPKSRYLDLRAAPELIRTELEDFLPWSDYPAIDEFYRLLEWLNGPTSPLESNDCAFSPPRPHERGDVAAELECTGRVVILFRDLQRNTTPHDLTTLTRGLHEILAPIDPTFMLGVIGTTLAPVRYRALPEGTRGRQLIVSFWAWGDSELETMTNLTRVMNRLAHALRELARRDAP